MLDFMSDDPESVPIKLSITEQMAYCTVRIETNNGTGTGFFYQFRINETTAIPIVVTNKHVVAGTTTGKFLMTRMQPDGSPDTENHCEYEFPDFPSNWKHHPDADVDLCAMPIASVITMAEADGIRLFYRTISNELLPTNADREEFNPVEEIIMVGYPNGLWDEAHNMPIFRRGITASHPNLNWNGKPEFLIDAACYPGSSGSPVFLLNQGGYTTRSGGTHLGSTRIKFLGVLYAGPQQSIEGEITIVDVPTQNKPIAVSRMPINLGIVIYAEKVEEFGTVLKADAGITA